jgi:hypothetical protein
LVHAITTIRLEISSIIGALLIAPEEQDTSVIDWLDGLGTQFEQPSFPPSQIPDTTSPPAEQVPGVDPALADEIQTVCKFQRHCINSKIYMLKGRKTPVPEIVEILDDALEVIVRCFFNSPIS